MIGQRHEKARMQSDFYRDSYYKILKGLMFLVVIMLALILLIIYYVFYKPPAFYYATTTTGQIIPIVPANPAKR